MEGLQTVDKKYLSKDVLLNSSIRSLCLGNMSIVVMVIYLFFGVANVGHGQETMTSFFTPSDTFSQKRFNQYVGFGVGTYATFSAGLYFAWYKDYPMSGFHFFDDRGEWLDMDKAGHVYSTYFQTQILYSGAKWTGLSDRKALLLSSIAAGLSQSTIEVLDGFSDQWGFSVADMGANMVGISAFALQQHYWNEQRITLKVSLMPSTYDAFEIVGAEGTRISSRDRRDDLYGSTYLERYLKDYNSQSYWASFHIHSFLPEGNKWPSWLNLALGYSAENMYGGFSNSWESEGELFSVSEDAYPRVRQYYLGFDLDLRHIKTKNKFAKTLLSIFNIFKMPSPALEINSRGEFTFHLLR